MEKKSKVVNSNEIIMKFIISNPEISEWLKQTEEGKKIIEGAFAHIRNQLKQKCYLVNPEILPPESERNKTVDDIPDDIKLEIFKFLTYRGLGRTCLSSKEIFYEIYEANKNDIKKYFSPELEILKEKEEKLKKELLKLLSSSNSLYLSKIAVDIINDLAKTDIGKKRVDEIFNGLDKKVTTKVQDIRCGSIGIPDIEFYNFRRPETQLKYFPILQKGKYPKLRTVYVNKNALTELILPNNVTEVYCFLNRIEILKCKGVEELDCRSNYIKKIIAKKAKNIKCSGNSLLTHINIPQDIWYQLSTEDRKKASSSICLIM